MTTPAQPATGRRDEQPAAAGGRAWLAVVSIALCSFSLVLSEFLPIGLLTDIAGGLRVSTGTAGLLVVAPGLAATIAAPAVAILASRLNRRLVLVSLAVLIAASDVIATLSPDLAVMLVARVLLGIGVGGFWVFGIGVAPRLVDERHGTRATAIVTSGLSLATVVSLPLGALIGAVASWRVAFAVGAALAVAALIAQLVFLPSLPTTTRNTFRTLLGILASPRSRTVLLASAATFIAQFGAYTYLEPYLRDRAGFDSTGVTLVLLAFGVAGLTANFLAPRLVDASPARAVIALVALTGVSIGALPWVSSAPAATVIVVVLWGMWWGALPLGLQIFVMRTAGHAAESGQAMFVSISQISLAFGSAAGGILVNAAGLGPAFEVAALIAIAGAAAVAVRSALHRSRPLAASAADEPAR